MILQHSYGFIRAEHEYRQARSQRWFRTHDTRSTRTARREAARRTPAAVPCPPVDAAVTLRVGAA